MPNEVEIINATSARVIDSKDRVIVVKLLSAMERMRLYGLAGAENSQVPQYMGYAVLSACVQKIGDLGFGFPRSRGDLEGNVGILGDEGIVAVARAMKALAPPEEEDVAAAAQSL